MYRNSNQNTSPQNKNSNVGRELVDFTNSTARMVKEGWGILREDPAVTASKIMTDEQYVNLLTQTADEFSRNGERIERRLESGISTIDKIVNGRRNGQ